jgi:peptidoglycan/LPS O-acetylase OafA/YrhL
MTAERAPARPQYLLVNVLKVVAAQCIVLHHFSAYGPLSDAAAKAWPDLMDALFHYARLAVQIFLVTAGYLAARGLAMHRHTLGTMAAGLWQRYVRLAAPFIVALLITLLCSSIARPYLEADVVPSAPSLAGFLAHASLLHSVMDVESLSAGVWYVAIDFQLYATLALLLWISHGKRWLSLWLVVVLTASSIVWFNTDASWDVWALYFFGAYGLGALAWWAGLRAKHGIMAVALYATALSAGLASLTVDFRERLALALSVSALLASFGNAQWRAPPVADKWIARLSSVSYALFLVHFAVLLLANAAWAWLGWEDGDGALLFMGAGWLVTLLASHLFHVHIEKRISQLRRSPRAVTGPQAAK